MENKLSKADIDHINLFKSSVSDKDKYNIRQLMNMKKQALDSGTPLQLKRAQIIDLELTSRGKPKDPVKPVAESKKVERDLTDKIVAERYLEKLDCARKKGIEFSLTIADVRRLLSRKKCHYTEIHFDLSIPQFRPSFDRVDSSKGYTKENVVVCMSAINELKNQLLESDGAIFKGRPDLLLTCAENFKKTIEKSLCGK